MKPRVRIELSENGEEEIIIRTKQLDDKALRLKSKLESSFADDISLFLADREYIIKYDDVLFFETDGGRLAAHTKNNIYYTEKSLVELLKLLPEHFIRVSKSCVLNVGAVFSLSRSLTGICEVSFHACDKKAYVSRMYYKEFRETLEETRLLK